MLDHLRTGEGEPLLLIHGFTATWHVWGPVPGLLAAEGFDVLAPTLGGHSGGPDLPPEGASVPLLADGLEAMLDGVGWTDPVDIAGFSLGGWLAFELARRGRARTVTAIAPGGATTERHDRESRRIRRTFATAHTAAARFGARTEGLARRPGWRRLTLRDQMVDGSKVPPREAVEMTRRFAETPVFRRILDEIGMPPGLEGLDEVAVPVTVLWGERDRILPQRLHEPFFRERLPHARFTTLRGAGHVPFWEATGPVVEGIVATTRRAVDVQAASTG